MRGDANVLDEEPEGFGDPDAVARTPGEDALISAAFSSSSELHFDDKDGDDAAWRGVNVDCDDSLGVTLLTEVRDDEEVKGGRASRLPPFASCPA